MNPVSVLLDDMSVELVDCESSDLPPGVRRKTEISPSSSYSSPPEVLVELGFINLSDSIAAHWDQSAADALACKEEHGTDDPDSKGPWECKSFDISLKKVVEVPGHGEPS